MKRTAGPLEISFRNGVGSANYTDYPINNGDCVPVEAHDACRVCFAPPGVFENRKHDAGEITEWCPEEDDVTVTYTIIDPNADCPRYLDKTYSITVGSGLTKKSKRKSKGTSKKKPTGKPRKKPARKSRKRTGRKSSSRRRK
jgi:hypothetical protein